MISFVSGRIVSVAPDGAVVEVGGVGLAVQCSPAVLAHLRPGEHARVPTSLVVREDSLTLYGFSDDDERATFELLQTASGVGPRLALAMLAVHAPDALRRAVGEGDIAALTRVPGIGRKGAQRIILELKDRLGPPEERQAPAAVGSPGSSWREQLHTGLVGLGWSAREAEQAVTTVAPEAEEMAASGETPDVGRLLRSALGRLSRS
ncbi:MAG: Holliday junction branch migration protein RuvA [Streptosporangiaceae bacterium]